MRKAEQYIHTSQYAVIYHLKKSFKKDIGTLNKKNLSTTESRLPFATKFYL